MLTSIAELITFMALAAKQGDRWAGKMDVYVGDNSNVKGWLTTRRSGNRFVRFLLRLLPRMEGQHRFQTIAVYIRTEHNVFSDDLTRLPLAGGAGAARPNVLAADGEAEDTLRSRSGGVRVAARGRQRSPTWSAEWASGGRTRMVGCGVRTSTRASGGCRTTKAIGALRPQCWTRGQAHGGGASSAASQPHDRATLM